MSCRNFWWTWFQRISTTRWLDRKAIAHVRRDKKRGNATATNKEYKQAIDAAVEASHGMDAYTGESLEWALISEYKDDDSKIGGRGYKKQFALLPSVDHVGDGTGRPVFRICAWRTNDAKGDLSYEEFLDLCRKVLKFADKLS